jgi:hypothetical protein
MDGMSIIVMYKGVALAALVPLDNTDYETVSLSTNPECIAMLERSRARGHEERGVSTAEMRKMFEKEEG